jgi:hypothetical protein
MTASRFFRLVWRVNGVLVLALLLLGVALVVGEFVSDLARDATARAEEDPALARTEAGERLELGDAEAVAGTPFVLLPLATRGERSGKFSSGGEPSVTRNLLFFDAASGAARWLRPDHRGVVAERTFLRDPPAARRDADGPVRFVRYELATADTDGDGEVTGEDALDVAVSGPGGDGLATVLAAPDAILGYQELPDGVLLVFHRRGPDHLVARVDLSAREVVRTTKLPAP